MRAGIRPVRRRSHTNVLLRGGLGNQMFQYAAGLAVALRTGSRLRLDLTVLDRDEKRDFGLDALRAEAELVRADDAEPMPFEDLNALRDEAERRYGATPVVERGNSFDNELKTASANSLLVGYWQSDRYFEGAEGAVTEAFSLRSPSDEFLEARSRIKSEPTVAVHVRRGDYAADRSVQRVIGLIDESYFRDAAKAISARTGVHRFHVFSDDVAWCTRHLDLPGECSVASAQLRDAEELRLIAACDHAVVSNSSFSWWGAWLGSAPNRMVVAPESWFPGVDSRAGSRIPAGWATVPMSFVATGVE